MKGRKHNVVLNNNDYSIYLINAQLMQNILVSKHERRQAY
jgi:hypothetical protein